MGDWTSDKDPIGPWRRKAMNAYTLAIAVVQGVLVLPTILVVSIPPVLKAVSLAGWALVVTAAALRRAPTVLRAVLLVLSSWVWAGAMLYRAGIFHEFRVVMLVFPLPMLFLVGVRTGLVLALIDFGFLVAALWATEVGILPTTAPPWFDGEWLFHAVAAVGIGLPIVLLLAWFCQHLVGTLRREQVAVERLQDEAAARVRLEGELIEVGERERRRIGHDLHDGVCQDLTGILIRARRAQTRLQTGKGLEPEVMEGIVESVGDAIREIHDLSRELSPGALAGRDLVGALDDLVRRAAGVCEAEVTFRSQGEGPSPDPAEALQAYRIAQEAMANAMRHSAAGRIEVTLVRDPGGMTLRVEDDGCGLPPDGGSGLGLGLRTMAWRAERVGGTFAMGPGTNSRGTRIECRIPTRVEAT
jgi:signal transduction histidine kinase